MPTGDTHFDFYSYPDSNDDIDNRVITSRMKLGQAIGSSILEEHNG